MLPPRNRRCFRKTVEWLNGDAYDKSCKSWDHMVTMVSAQLRAMQLGGIALNLNAPGNVAQMREVPRRLATPRLPNLILGSLTPILPAWELQAVGFAAVGKFGLSRVPSGPMKDFRAATIPASATVIPMWPMPGTTVMCSANPYDCQPLRGFGSGKKFSFENKMNHRISHIQLITPKIRQVVLLTHDRVRSRCWTPPPRDLHGQHA
jgi:hypothetical protein